MEILSPVALTAPHAGGVQTGPGQTQGQVQGTLSGVCDCPPYISGPIAAGKLLEPSNDRREPRRVMGT